MGRTNRRPRLSPDAPPARLVLALPPNLEALWAVMQDLRRQQQRFEQGEDMALLTGLGVWLTSMPCPDWIRENYVNRLRSFQQYEAKTLDAAFRVERPKRRRRDARNRRETFRWMIVFRVEQLRHQENLPLAESLFDRVGREVGVPWSFAREVYFERASDRYFQALRHLITRWTFRVPEDWRKRSIRS